MPLNPIIRRLGLASALLTGLLSVHDAIAEETKPNIVFILMDNLG
jgi:hypothetical protein